MTSDRAEVFCGNIWLTGVSSVREMLILSCGIALVNSKPSGTWSDLPGNPRWSLRAGGSDFSCSTSVAARCSRLCQALQKLNGETASCLLERTVAAVCTQSSLLGLGALRDVVLRR